MHECSPKALVSNLVSRCRATEGFIVLQLCYSWVLPAHGTARLLGPQTD